VKEQSGKSPNSPSCPALAANCGHSEDLTRRDDLRSGRLRVRRLDVASGRCPLLRFERPSYRRGE
jgi:hypothetical protein